MAIILFDDNAHQTLLPLTFTRPVADLRVGILTIAQKWGKHLKSDFSFHTQTWLTGKFPLSIEADNLFINGSVCPDEQLLEAIDKLETGDLLKHHDQLIVVKLKENDAVNFDLRSISGRIVELEYNPVIINFPEDIFRNNDTELRKDFGLLTKGRSSATISSTNTIIGNDFFV